MARFESIESFTPHGLGELKAWLEPWFLQRDSGCCVHWEDVGVGCVSEPPSLSEIILAEPCLTAFWKLDDTSGDIAVDSGPSGYDLDSGATLVAPTWGQPAGPPGSLTPQFGITSGLSTSSIPALSGDLSAEVWFSRDDTSGAILVGQGMPTTNAPGWQLYVENASEGLTNRPQLIVGRSVGGISYIEADSAISADTWYHVATTRESGEWKLYVNGVQQATTITPTYDATSGFYIGDNADAGFGSGSLHGRMSYAGIYNCALSAESIAAHYAAGIA